MAGWPWWDTWNREGAGLPLVGSLWSCCLSCSGRQSGDSRCGREQCSSATLQTTLRPAQEAERGGQGACNWTYDWGETKTRHRSGGPLPKACARKESCKPSQRQRRLEAGKWRNKERDKYRENAQELGMHAAGAHHPDSAGALQVGWRLELCDEDGRLLLNSGDPVWLPRDVPCLQALTHHLTSREGGHCLRARVCDERLANAARPVGPHQVA